MNSSLFVMLALFLVFPHGVFAENSKKYVLAEELVVSMGMDKRFASVREQLEKITNSQIDAIQVTDYEKIKLKELKKISNDILINELSWKNMKEPVIKMYEETYTEQELRDILVFFKSPVGKKYVDKMPELNQKMIDISQIQAQRMMPKILAAINEYKQKNGMQ